MALDALGNEEKIFAFDYWKSRLVEEGIALKCEMMSL